MHYFIDANSVSHDRLQDEVIIINVASGSYYSGSGPAADIWTLIAQGASIPEAARILSSAYAFDEGQILRDVESCVGTLVERGLIQTADTPSPVTAGIALPEATRSSWATPEFDEYSDMWELIKLDPIHEVGEVGWPQPKT